MSTGLFLLVDCIFPSAQGRKEMPQTQRMCSDRQGHSCAEIVRSFIALRHSFAVVLIWLAPNRPALRQTPPED